MRKKRMLITSPESMVIEFLLPHIEMLLNGNWEIELACSEILNDFDLLERKLDKRIKIHRVSLARSPFSIKENYKGYKELKLIIEKENFDLIWTNGPVIGVITRLAAMNVRKQGVKVLYIAHGFHFYKGSPLINWLLYYPIERCLSNITDVLVTINKEDFKRAQSFHASQVQYIPGIGVDIEKFNYSTSHTKQEIDNLRTSLGIPGDAIICLSVGELHKRKNHEIIIHALAKLNTPHIYYLICGKGEEENYLKKIVNEKKLNQRVKLLGYRKDIDKLCEMSHIFIHPSVREGLGIAALEGMAAGLPLIASNINGIKDYTENGKTGFCIQPRDIEGFAKAISLLAENEKTRIKMGEYNKIRVEVFDTKRVQQILKKIFDSI